MANNEKPAKNLNEIQTFCIQYLVKTHIVFVCIALLAAFQAIAAGEDNKVWTCFVATNGNDMATGTSEKPFLTLKRARDEARKMGATQQRRILIKGGNYFDVSVPFGPED